MVRTVSGHAPLALGVFFEGTPSWVVLKGHQKETPPFSGGPRSRDIHLRSSLQVCGARGVARNVKANLLKWAFGTSKLSLAMSHEHSFV